MHFPITCRRTPHTIAESIGRSGGIFVPVEWPIKTGNELESAGGTFLHRLREIATSRPAFFWPECRKMRKNIGTDRLVSFERLSKRVTFRYCTLSLHRERERERF